jgi:hypothetical protein
VNTHEKKCNIFEAQYIWIDKEEETERVNKRTEGSNEVKKKYVALHDNKRGMGDETLIYIFG